MLSKKQLKELRAATEPLKGIADAQAPLDVSELLALLDHITELEENATAKALALKAAKAMQQSETERADANERDAGRYRWLRKRHWSDSTLAVVAVPKRSVKLGEDCPSEERLDAAIDQAMRNP